MSLIDNIQYRRLYKELSARGWLKNEPHEFEEESPKVVPLILQEFQRSYGMSRRDVAHALGWKPDTFSEVTGLDIQDTQGANPKRMNVINIGDVRRALSKTVR